MKIRNKIKKTSTKYFIILEKRFEPIADLYILFLESYMRILYNATEEKAQRN